MKRRWNVLQFGVCAWLMGVLLVHGQSLRFSNHREVKIPEYATVRLGPFYSDIIFSQTVGYRRTTSTGTGTTFLYSNDRGELKSDGTEYPLVSALTFRNYLLISRRMDLDLSLHMVYSHYPNETQENAFDISMAEEGVSGSLSSTYQPSPFVRATFYDNLALKTDYLDVRGVSDRQGGQEHKYFSNTLGMNGDMLVTLRDNVGMGFSRQDYLVLDKEFEEADRVAYSEQLSYERELFKGFVLGGAAQFTQTDYKLEERSDISQQDYSFHTSYGFGEAFDDDAMRLKVSRSSVLSFRLGFSVGTAQGGRLSRDETENTNITVYAESDSSRIAFTGGATLRTQLREDMYHTLRYDRGLRGGFSSAFEEYQTFAYDLYWQDALTKINVFSHMDDVLPSGIGDTDYRSWESGVRVVLPLTRIIKLDLQTAYTLRTNKEADEAEADEVLLTQAAEDEVLERTNDYQTWTSRAGTSFAVTRRVRFNAYGQHVERLADAEALAYARDTIAATLTYSHKF